MHLSAHAIREFQAIWQEEYGESLSDAQAEEHALRLLRLFQILSRPLPHDSHPQLQKGRTFDNSPSAGTMEEGST
jgi:hypothetical protein